MEVIRLKAKPRNRVVMVLEPSEAETVANLLDYAYHKDGSAETKAFVKRFISCVGEIVVARKRGEI
ncbi:hypothetical protein [Tannerella forsythia]|uniref:Uncharacterized protein n=1 Tax=Tannerella forsythia TaxID=28112 RepID=A0A2A6E9I8_TANFO|nr:hypothetical protein [Tannerella forsythia]PDP44691.1 hypothetical protein CLI86_02095 [Tannerella forsythia]